MLEKRVIIQKNESSSSTRQKPVVIKWKGISMIRNQSFMAAIREIVDYSAEMDVVRVGIVGDMMSGKSTLALSIAHATHTIAKIPYAVRVFYREDLKNFKQTIKSLKPANYVLVFDDVSFMKDTSTIEKEITEIRHLEGGHDVKMILIFNFHYPKALPPFLREFQFKFVTSIGTDNEKTIADNYGKKNIRLISDFKMTRKGAIVKKYWFERIQGKEAIKMNFRNPFIPILFWNENSMRKIVSPTRYFMDKVCSVCEFAEGNKKYEEMTVEELCEKGVANFGKGNFLAAIKLLMHTNGLTTYGKKVVQSIRWIEREQKIRNIPIPAFAGVFGLEETKTKLRKPEFDDVD